MSYYKAHTLSSKTYEKKIINAATYMNRYKSHYVLLLLASRYEHENIISSTELDAKRNTS